MLDLQMLGITPMTAVSALVAGYALGWAGMKVMAERATRRPPPPRPVRWRPW